MSEANEVPPNNEEAERELLGSLLAYYTPELFAKVDEAVKADDFYSAPGYPAPGRIIYRAICAVADTGGHVDRVTVAHFLAGRSDSAKRSYLDLAGGGSALDLLVSYAVPHGVVDRARIVAKDAEWRRRLVKARGQAEACLRRDEGAWLALEGDVPRLRVVDGGKAVAS